MSEVLPAEEVPLRRTIVPAFDFWFKKYIPAKTEQVKISKRKLLKNFIVISFINFIL
jgi:hypothetical protein